jgi:hypothetical protein
MPVKNQLQGMLAVFEPLDRAQSKKTFEPSFVKIDYGNVSHNGPFGQDQKWLRHILDSETNGEYYFKHVQFHFSDRITYNLWEKTKVETLSADYSKKSKL